MSTDTMPHTDTASTSTSAGPAGPSRPALTAKGAATRLRIIEAAAARIRRRGATGTSIDDVRADAKVSASQLYHYFSDKKELVRAVVAYEAAAAIAEQQPQLGAIDSIESLRAWKDSVVARARRRGRGDADPWSPLGALTSELIDTDPDARAGLVEGFELWLAPVESGLAAMRASGALRNDADPRDLALALLSALQGGQLVARLHGDSAPLEAALDAAIARVASFGPPTAGPATAGAAARQPMVPAARRTPALPGRASAHPAASTQPAQPAASISPADAPITTDAPTTARVPMRPRRPAGR